MQDSAKVGLIATGDGNTFNITQNILPKSQEYAVLKERVAAAKAKLDEKNQELTKAEASGSTDLVAYIRKERDQRAGEYQAELKTLTDFKEDVLRLAKTFAEIELKSERLRTAKKLFDEGKIREADAVLNTAELESETKQLLQKQNVIAQEAADNDSLLSVKASEWLIKAQITKTRYDLTEWYDSAHYYFRLSLQCRSSAENQFDYARFLQDHNQIDSAITYYFLVFRSYVESGDTVNINLASTQNNLGMLYCAQNEYGLAAAAYGEALSICRRLVENDPVTYDPDLALIQNNLGNLYSAQNEYDLAVSAYGESLSIYQSLAAADPATYDSYVAGTQNNLGNLYSAQNVYSLAAAAYGKALSIYQRLSEVNPTAYDPYVAGTQNNRGLLYSAQNEYDLAAAAYSESLLIYRRLAATNPATYDPCIAGTQSNRGLLCSAQNEYDLAAAAYGESLSIYRRLAAANPLVFEIEVAKSSLLFALLKQQIGQPDEANKLFQEALEITNRYQHIPFANKIRNMVLQSVSSEVAE
ncbi:MAG: tetratricopeptide repeat protein [Cyanobacteria bacterium J06600_6]